MSPTYTHAHCTDLTKESLDYLYASESLRVVGRLFLVVYWPAQGHILNTEAVKYVLTEYSERGNDQRPCLLSIKHLNIFFLIPQTAFPVRILVLGISS